MPGDEKLENFTSDYLKLVQDFICYLKQESFLAPFSVFKKEEISPAPIPAPSLDGLKEGRTEAILPALPEREESKKEPLEMSFGEMKKAALKAFPDLRLVEKPLNDALAQRRANVYKSEAPQVALIMSNEKQLPFLSSLEKAISNQLAPAQIMHIDKIEKQEAVRLIVATYSDVAPHPTFKESPKPLLLGIPLILLAPIAEYDQNPPLKRALWDHLCQLLK